MSLSHVHLAPTLGPGLSLVDERDCPQYIAQQMLALWKIQGRLFKRRGDNVVVLVNMGFPTSSV